MAGASDASAREAGVSLVPDYKLEFVPSTKRVRVVFRGVIVADSARAMIMRETRHAPVYYLPRTDVRMDLMRPTDHHTHCPFKGNASYWTLSVDGHTVENAMWSYQDPFEEVAHIKDYVAFYSQKMDALYEEDEPLSLDQAAATHAHPNRFVDWLLREAWEAIATEELVARLARRLVEVGFPLWRLRFIIRTLHPQLMGTSYTWRRDADTVTITTASHRVAETEAFIDSPLFVVFQGAGGIRRRLEGPDARLDFPVVKELQAEGATDYVAMPLLFSDGQINAITIASDRPGGFTTGDLGQVYEILPLLSRLFEVQAMRLTMKTILDTYLGTRTGERVLAGLIKRGDGTDIPAVIWYVDLRDSTAMAESMERSRYLGALNDFFECTAGVVLDHGGEVLKFIGDAVLAIFPVQSDRAVAASGSEDAAAAACRVALEAARAALDRLAVLNRDRAGRDEPPLRCALALHLGEVTYGNIGVAKRLDFTVIGPAANEAARLSGLCKSLRQAVLASEEFARHAPGHLVELGRHSLRGVSGERGVFGLAEGST
jgi:uncharacterized protein (DUF427 family)/class 3 adenylate cyclase